MIGQLRGAVGPILDGQCIIDVGGVGYLVHMPQTHLACLPPAGEQVVVHTSFVVRDDSHLLFGFMTTGERDLFEVLTGVSGVGPKTALALLGFMSADQLQEAIETGDVKTICKAPGIGKKTAERMIIDLRDKCAKFAITSTVPTKSPAIRDALSALINLGYSQARARAAIDHCLETSDQEPTLATLITESLRQL